LNSQSFYNRIKITLVFLISVITIGVLGFMLIEGFTFIEALYMTIITVSTVGFKEVRALSPSGQIFTIFLIITSFGTFAYAISVLSQSLINGEVRRALIDRQVFRKVNKLNNHVIVCGYGRNGRQAVRKLHAYGMEYVVIEREGERIERLKREGIPWVQGDSTRDGFSNKPVFPKQAL
jgi:voltage-gated potassium channel